MKGAPNPSRRRARPKVVKLKPPKGDGAMADTMLFLLERVRLGKVKSYSICLIVERADGSSSSIESATADGDSLRELQLLGVMRGAEHALFRRREERLTQESSV